MIEHTSTTCTATVSNACVFQLSRQLPVSTANRNRSCVDCVEASNGDCCKTRRKTGGNCVVETDEL